jgi:hypothetical protein
MEAAMYRLAACTLFLASFTIPAMACPDGQHDQCVLRDPNPFSNRCIQSTCVPNAVPHVPAGPGGVPGVPNVGIPGLSGLAQNALNEGNLALRQAADNVNEYVNELTDEAKSAIEEAIKNATEDTVRNVVKAANDIVDAAQAVGRFAERELQGQGDILSDAERRIREGKVADAIWHIGTGKRLCCINFGRHNL